MPKKGSYALKLACMELARADTGAGGLVPLTGKDVPVVRDKDPDELDPPEIGVRFLGGRQSAGVPEELAGILAFPMAVPMGSEGLEDDLLDRLEAVLTQQGFQAEGLDVRLGRWRVRDLQALSEGSRRYEAEVDAALTR